MSEDSSDEERPAAVVTRQAYKAPTPEHIHTSRALHRYLIDRRSKSTSALDVDFRVCSNCNKKGHVYKTCAKPIISCGVIAWRRVESTANSPPDIEYLSIARKNSIAYIDVLRGKYKLTPDMEYLLKLLRNMTFPELTRLREDRDLEGMWQDASLMYLKRNTTFEYDKSRAKLSSLWNGVHFQHSVTHTLMSLIDSVLVPGLPLTTGWGFPKGRRNKYENDLQCAMREFHEETGYKISNNFKMTMDPGSNKYIRITESFLGLNGFAYEYRYFVTELINSSLVEPTIMNTFQKAEIGGIGWYRYKELKEMYIRPELVSVLDNIHSFLEELLLNGQASRQLDEIATHNTETVGD